jgi:hypothetical protein
MSKCNIALKTTSVVTLRPVDTLVCRENADGSVRYVSDVSLLFNEDRIINDIGEDNFRALVRSMQEIPSSPYYDSGLTDEQLIETVKSRYIQSPSEVRAWVEQMVDQSEIVRTEYEQLVAEVEASEQSPVESPEVE